jgi:hypothetical protein
LSKHSIIPTGFDQANPVHDLNDLLAFLLSATSPVSPESK